VPGLHLLPSCNDPANEAAEEYPGVRIVRTLDELLGDEGSSAHRYRYFPMTRIIRWHGNALRQAAT